MRIGIAGVLIVLSLGLHIPSEAGVFWEDSFEYANAAAMGTLWDGPSCGGEIILAPTTARPRTGAKSLQEHFTGVPPNYEGGGSCFFGGRRFTRTQTLFTRFYMYLTDHAGTGNFNVGTPTTKIALQYGNGHPISAWLILPFGTNTLAFAVQHRSGNAENIYSSGSIPQRAWTCVESEMTNNSGYGVPDGILRLWINGTQVLNKTNHALLEAADIERPGFDTVRLYTQNGLGRIYYDDYAVGNTRIGCGGIPTSSDLTPPAAPVGVTIR